jgi:hypothetical protein
MDGLWVLGSRLLPPCFNYPERSARDNWIHIPAESKSRFSMLDYFFHRQLPTHMLLSKEYVGYLARETVKRLAASEFIETKSLPLVTEKVHAAMLEDLSTEDRINDEVRVILEAYSDEMRNSGADYQEMFRKVKSELVRKYKAVL